MERCCSPAQCGCPLPLRIPWQCASNSPSPAFPPLAAWPHDHRPPVPAARRRCWGRRNPARRQAPPARERERERGGVRGRGSARSRRWWTGVRVRWSVPRRGSSLAGGQPAAAGHRTQWGPLPRPPCAAASPSRRAGPSEFYQVLTQIKAFSFGGGGCSRNAVYYPGKFSGHETKEHPFIVKPSVTAELNKQAA